MLSAGILPNYWSKMFPLPCLVTKIITMHYQHHNTEFQTAFVFRIIDISNNQKSNQLFTKK